MKKITEMYEIVGYTGLSEIVILYSVKDEWFVYFSPHKSVREDYDDIDYFIDSSERL